MPAPAPIPDNVPTTPTYYVSANGDDAGAGTSPSTAWRSLARVNATHLSPGANVFLEGGSTFGGTLQMLPGEGGTTAAPTVISSYGSGPATIASGNASAIIAYDTAGIRVSRLHVVGSGPSNTGAGIEFYSDLAGNQKLTYIDVEQVEANGFGTGVIIGGWNGTTGFQDVTIQHSNVHDNVQAGIQTYGQGPGAANLNVTVDHVLAYDNLGDPANTTTNSGSGIVLGSVHGGRITRSVAHDNGILCTAPEAGVGIWAYDSQDIVIDHNESYHNRTGGFADGDGFDLDINMVNSTLEYNYSHDNDGSGFLLYSGSMHRNNTVRYNISENDARKLTDYGAIQISGAGNVGDTVYANTVFIGPSPSGTPPAVQLTGSKSGVTLRNNILDTSGSGPAIQADGASAVGTLLQGNDYYAGGAPPRIAWGNNTYSGVAAWRQATAQETLGGTATGLSSDPKLTAPGAGGTLGDADNLETTSAYRLLPGSPAIDSGLDLGALGVNAGQDLWNRPAPTGPGFDIGANEAS